MALTKSILKTVNGEQTTFSNAYIKIFRISGSKMLINANIETLSEKDGKQLEKTVHSFRPTLDGSNFIAQAYEQIKQLPEFADATDC
jgi:transcription elongation factor GreA-like protein